MTPSLKQRLDAGSFQILSALVVALIGASMLPIVVGMDASLYFWLMIVSTTVLGALGFVRIRKTSHRLAADLSTIAQTAREIARGDLDRELDPEDVQDIEVRDVCEAFNGMAARARADIDEMRRLARVRSEFIGNVSHELRTPIFSVQGYLETLIDGAVDDIRVRDEFLHKAHQNVLRLHALLADLIEISRIESGEMRMSMRYFNLVEFMQGIIMELQASAEISSVDLSLDAPAAGGAEILVLGDRERLKQVVVNLVENAIKYNRPGGRVVVSVARSGGKAVVSVQDNGIGIPEQDLGRIFERFYRVNRDRSRAVGGSGLGLAIVKHILEKHGTAIEVESSPGVGSTFRFALST